MSDNEFAKANEKPLKNEKPAAPALTDAEKELLELFRAADAKAKIAAVAILKGEKPAASAGPDVMSMLSGMRGGGQSAQSAQDAQGGGQGSILDMLGSLLGGKDK